MDFLKNLSIFNTKQICKGCDRYQRCLTKAETPSRTIGNIAEQLFMFPIAIIHLPFRKISFAVTKIAAIHY